MTFQELGLQPNLLKSISEMGFLHPSPIQEQAIPVVLSEPILSPSAHRTGKRRIWFAVFKI